MSATTSFDEERVRRAAAVLAGVAVELRALAVGAVDDVTRVDWVGGAARRHEEQVRHVAEELRATATRLDELVDEARTAIVRARTLAAFRRAALDRAVTTLAPRVPAVVTGGTPSPWGATAPSGRSAGPLPGGPR